MLLSRQFGYHLLVELHIYFGADSAESSSVRSVGIDHCELAQIMGTTGLGSSLRVVLVWIVFFFVLQNLGSCFGKFADNFYISWGGENVVANDDSNSVSIKLTKTTGARIVSRDAYLYGAFSVKLKLVPGDSAGTVCSLYMSSGDTGGNHDEIDFEFLGNVSGQPYVLHTNLFARDRGERENQMFLWFDPSADFHDYLVIWNHKQIVWYVDNVPIRVYKNIDANTYLASAQTVTASIFDGSEWATRGGRDPTNWDHAPFIAVYKDFSFDACKVVNNDASACEQNYAQNWWEAPEYQSLDAAATQKMKDTLRQYRIYNYCTDSKKFPTPPRECAYNDV